MLPRMLVAMTLSLALAMPFTAGAAELNAQTFAAKAAQSDMFELEAAKLVMEKGQGEHVKTFAQDMIRDHHESSEALQEAAAKDGVALPKALSPELAEKLEALKPLSGPALDAAYVSTQVSVHTEAVALFDAYSKDGPSDALKSFAMKTYPTIRMHLVRIRGFNVE